MHPFYITPEEYKAFILILVRTATIFFMFPIFGSPMIPNTIKAGMSLVLTFFLFPVVKVNTALFPQDFVSTGILIVSELFIGMVLGLTVRLFFAAVQLAGQLIGFQMGFAMINVIDPQTGAQVTIIEQIAFWTVLLVFLLLNGHHILIRGIVDSFRIVDVGLITLKPGFLKPVLVISGQMFMLAIKIGAPPITALLLTSAAFGLTAKFEPRMNIMIVGFPVKIAVGLFFFGFMLQVVILFTRGFVSDFYGLIRSMLMWMGG